MNQPTYYELLGIKKTASQEEIKKAYRAAAKKYHPDENEVANASIIFKMVNEAYETLSDVGRRNEYDQTLDAPKAQQPPPPPTPEPQPKQHTYQQEQAPNANSTTYSYTFYENEDGYEEIVYTKPRRKLPFPLNIIWAIVRTLLKIIFVPSLTVICWFLSMTTGIITAISRFISILLFIGVLLFWWRVITDFSEINLATAIASTISSFLLSPWGLPRFAAWFVQKLDIFRLFIKNL